MQLATETFGNVMVVHTPDELTGDTASAFLDALNEPIAHGQVWMVLEMDHTELYDSEGLTSLLDLQDRLAEKKGNLKICGLGDPGRKIFEMTRLDRRFDLFDSLIDAVSSFR
jgi:anti-sigma B factor antagonist